MHCRHACGRKRAPERTECWVCWNERLKLSESRAASIERYEASGKRRLVKARYRAKLKARTA